MGELGGIRGNRWKKWVKIFEEERGVKIGEKRVNGK